MINERAWPDVKIQKNVKPQKKEKKKFRELTPREKELQAREEYYKGQVDDLITNLKKNIPKKIKKGLSEENDDSSFRGIKNFLQSRKMGFSNGKFFERGFENTQRDVGELITALDEFLKGEDKIKIVIEAASKTFKKEIVNTGANKEIVKEALGYVVKSLREMNLAAKKDITEKLNTLITQLKEFVKSFIKEVEKIPKYFQDAPEWKKLSSKPDKKKKAKKVIPPLVPSKADRPSVEDWKQPSQIVR